jgi:hypothetical protein
MLMPPKTATAITMGTNMGDVAVHVPTLYLAVTGWANIFCPPEARIHNFLGKDD